MLRTRAENQIRNGFPFTIERIFKSSLVETTRELFLCATNRIGTILQVADQSYLRPARGHGLSTVPVSINRHTERTSFWPARRRWSTVVPPKLEAPRGGDRPVHFVGLLDPKPDGAFPRGCAPKWAARQAAVLATMQSTVIGIGFS